MGMYRKASRSGAVRSFRALAAGALFCMATAGAWAQALPDSVNQAWAKSGLPEAARSLYVQEVGQPPLWQISADVPRNPASVMKLVTTWAALSELGPSYTWRTEMLADPGALPDAQGRLNGPLYIRASGDPMLRFQDFWNLLRELRLRGIKQLGDIVVDRSVFGAVSIDPGAFDGSADRAYNASPDAFMVGFGATRLLFLPDPVARKWTPVMDPPLNGVRFEGEVTWSDARCPGAPVVSTTPVITPDGVRIRLAGTVAGSCGEFSFYRLAQSQPEQTEQVLRYLWRELGGELRGRIRNGTVPVDAVPLAAHESPPLIEAISLINKFSNNVAARNLLLTLGAESGQRPAQVATAAQTAANTLARQGIDVAGLNIDNGAGLSRRASVSASTLGHMLEAAWLSPRMPEYVSSMAILGLDGTVRRRLRDRDTQGMAHLKTGSLRDVRAIAGYVTSASGKRYIVVSMINHDNAIAGRAYEDSLIDWLIRQ
ncbi:D-alanyl-D-alanine carboxypeptidase/D-alanyl-D-alanine endopeptidase [Corticimicrobacter populi]